MSQSDESAAVRAWLVEVLKKTGLKATPLAKAAGLAPSTVLRALDTEKGATLDTRSIAKIVEKLKVAPPPSLFAMPGPAPDGFAESELEAVAVDGGTRFAGIVLTATQGVWRVRTRALELAGYLPGDEVLADSATQPRARDVVVAQVVDHRSGGAETVLRVYDPPYLITETAAAEARQKPVLVDNDRVSIWGPVIVALRARAA